MMTSVMVVMKMGNTVPRAGFKPTSLAFRASVLPLHHVGFPNVTTIPTPTCLCSFLPQRSVQTTTISLQWYCMSDRLGPKWINIGAWLIYVVDQLERFYCIRVLHPGTICGQTKMRGEGKPGGYNI